MKIYAGEYTGDGAASKDVTVTGLNSANDVFIIVAGENSGYDGAWRFSDQAGDTSSELADDTAEEAGLIVSIANDKFTVGVDPEANRSGYLFQYLVIEDNGENDFDCGSYTGTGIDHDESVSLGGSTPDLVFVQTAGTQHEVFRTSDMVGDYSLPNISYGQVTDCIEELKADAFNVGVNAKVNTNGVTYYYAAFVEASGYFKVGTYAGNGNDDQAKTGVGFQPDWLAIKGDRASITMLHTDSMGDSTDTTCGYGAVTPYADGIQSLDADGFEIGLSAHVNENTTDYFYYAWLVGETGSGATQGLVSDGITASEAIDRSYKTSALVSDGMSLVDSDGRLATYLVSLGDGVVGADNTSLIAQLQASLTDEIVMSETASAIGTILALVSDQVNAGDITNWESIVSAIISDKLIVSDTTSSILTALATVLSGINISDNSQVTATFQVEVDDNIQLIDAVATIAKFGASVVDGATFTDILQGEFPTIATGEANVTFSLKGGTLTFTIKKSKIEFVAKKSGVTFN